MRPVRDLPEKVSILIARLTYDGYERYEIANWLVQTSLMLDKHPRVANVFHKPMMGYPTPLVRNQALALCRMKRIDFLVMIDDDMVPDVHSPNRSINYGNQSEDTVRAAVSTNPLPIMRDQQNFLPSALDYALEHPGPCVIGAPYCAGPPEERVLVSRFREKEGDNPNGPCGGLQLECFTRDEAANRTGFEMVSSLPTGLILIDVRCTDYLKPPYFSYEYKNDHQLELASTEDTVFSRNCMYLNIPQYCAFSSWAAHAKNKIVGRPRKYPISAVPAQVEQAVREQIAHEALHARPADKTNPIALGYLKAHDGDDAPVVPLGEEEPCVSPNGCDDAKVCEKQGRCDGE